MFVVFKYELVLLPTIVLLVPLVFNYHIVQVYTRFHEIYHGVLVSEPAWQVNKAPASLEYAECLFDILTLAFL